MYISLNPEHAHANRSSNFNVIVYISCIYLRVYIVCISRIYVVYISCKYRVNIVHISCKYRVYISCIYLVYIGYISGIYRVYVA